MPGHGRFVEPEGLGHSPYLEDAPRLCGLVVDFLRTLALPPRA
jgi:hypothetical protein